MEQRARFVYQDNVLIERLIFDLRLRCEPPKEVVELLTGALRTQRSRTPSHK
jgi:hypothetical protein